MMNKNYIKKPKYYTRTQSGMYLVMRTRNGKTTHYGKYRTEEKAQECVKILKEHDWDKQYALKSEHHPRYNGLKNHKRAKLNKSDLKILKVYASSKRLQKKTYEGYKDSLILYITYTGKHIKELFKLYEAEEDELPWKKRTIKQELVGFRNYLYETYLPLSAQRYFSRVQTFFRDHEIELVPLPKVNNKNTNDLPPMTHKDMLTRDELKEVISIATPCMKAYTCFAATSGCARAEALSITVKDYLLGNDCELTNPNNEYNSYIRKQLIKLDAEDRVPLFKIKRNKTNKYYFTFCTPQANALIKEYLLGSDRKLKLDSPLFDLNFYSLNKQCNYLNDVLELGTCRRTRRFRSHMLRKYNASTLYNAGMHMEDVDSLQGRGKDSTHSAYFMEDPMKLKEKYVEYLEVLSI